MIIFVANCGSSSIKFQLFSMTNEIVLAKGVVERVGSPEANITLETEKGKMVSVKIDAPDHKEGLKNVLDKLVNSDIAILSSIDEIEGVGHRVVHGGEDPRACDSIKIDEGVIALVEKNKPLAPLHNPANLLGIEAAMAAMPNTTQVAVWDTAFLSTLPEKAYQYAVPREWYTDKGVRRYGFHGTSHRYVTLRAAEVLGKPVEDVNIITCHLGNGGSLTAIQGGKAVDHSMGMTPLEGLIMGTRCGDIDPGIIFYMYSQGLSVEEIDNALNKEAGLLGISGLSNDMRDLLGKAAAGAESAQLAVDMFIYRVVKYIGAYYAILPSVDAVVFTGGIGENSKPVREGVVKTSASLGAVFDEARNESTVGGACGPITANGSKLPVWVIPTNEELMIARDTRRIVAGG